MKRHDSEWCPLPDINDIQKFSLGTIYQKALRADPISDAELRFAIPRLQRLCADLLELGPVFQLSRSEVVRVWTLLEGFQMARKEFSRKD